MYFTKDCHSEFTFQLYGGGAAAGSLHPSSIDQLTVSWFLKYRFSALSLTIMISSAITELSGVLSGCYTIWSGECWLILNPEIILAFFDGAEAGWTPWVSDSSLFNPLAEFSGKAATHCSVWYMEALDLLFELITHQKPDSKLLTRMLHFYDVSNTRWDPWEAQLPKIQL